MDEDSPDDDEKEDPEDEEVADQIPRTKCYGASEDVCQVESQMLLVTNEYRRQHCDKDNLVSLPEVAASVETGGNDQWIP